MDSARNREDDSQQLIDLVRLALVPGVGPRIRQSLLERFETPARILSAAENELRSVPGVGPKLSAAIAAARREIDAEAELARCKTHGITVLTESSPPYPRLLREIPDPPGVLFCRGELLPQDALAIAIVGTRHATQYGRKHAELLAAGLARAGLTIVSGLARGIDAAAHRGALSAGGRTIAFLGSGLLNIYPPEHKQLAAEVADSGAIMSESPAHRAPVKGAFPQRNRLITGVSLGVIVIEAASSSGALISARHATEQNREVFAVPGRIDSRMSHGCHRLIRDGAKLVESVDDVLEELGPLVEKTSDAAGRAVHHPAELVLNEQERQVLDAIGEEPKTIDDVAVDSGLPIHRVLSTLSVLEMRRLVRRLSGQLVARV
ncbi:MAG: DNA-processing protein DprA [Pirellulaceae bacterium]